MGRYYNRHLSTFDDVRNWYEKTKPLVSKTHTREDDIRPIGNRSRKWERIEKINNNCYAFLTWGYDRISYYGGRDVETRTDPKELKRIAPILWERNPKTGEEFVTVHNYRTGYATSLYEFFRRYLPGSMTMPQSKDGRQWVVTSRGTYYLPHNKYLPPNFSDYYRTTDKKEREAYTRPSAERKLVFKREGDNFVLVSTPYELEGKARVLVKRDEKDAFRAEIREFKHFVRTMAPVIGGTPPTSRAETAKTVNDLVLAAVGEDKVYTYGRWWERYDVNTMRHALMNPENPMRVALVYAFIDYAKGCDWYVERGREDSNDLLNARLNTFVNRAFRFTKVNK